MRHQAKMFPRALGVAPLSMLICIAVLCVGQEFSDMPSVEPSALRLRDPHFDGCRSLYCYTPRTGSLVPPHEKSKTKEAVQNPVPFLSDHFHRDYLMRAPYHLKRAVNFTNVGLRNLRSGDVEDAFPFIWSGLQELFAATEKAPTDAETWHEAVVLLQRIFDARDLNQVKLRTVAEYMRRTIQLDPSDTTRASQYMNWLERLPEMGPQGHDVEHRHDVEDAMKMLADVANDGEADDERRDDDDDEDEDDENESRRARMPSTPLLAEDSKDVSDLFLPLPSPLMHPGTAEAVTREAMTTYSLWPTRVSTVHLPSRFNLTSNFNDLLNTAATDARNKYAQESGKRDPGDINNGFFHEQYQVEYSYMDERTLPCEERRFPDKPSKRCRMVAKGIEMFGSSEQQKAVADLMAMAHRMCAEHTVRGGGSRGQQLSSLNKSTLFIWAAVYTPGTSHSAHMHEDSMCSGVYYSRAEPGSTPITFSDPRGTDRLRLLLGQGGRLPEHEKHFEPHAPFHHQYSFFPAEGNMVLFPSYTAHEIHANPFDKSFGSRIVWAFNLHGEFESWGRLNV